MHNRLYLLLLLIISFFFSCSEDKDGLYLQEFEIKDTQLDSLLNIFTQSLNNYDSQLQQRGEEPRETVLTVLFRKEKDSIYLNCYGGWANSISSYIFMEHNYRVLGCSKKDGRDVIFLAESNTSSNGNHLSFIWDFISPKVKCTEQEKEEAGEDILTRIKLPEFSERYIEYIQYPRMIYDGGIQPAAPPAWSDRFPIIYYYKDGVIHLSD
ncbi:hypothetical protein [Dysgonomonas sp. 25]|uniref:hypothetical protein n=1 Tax=Dysgonomonas sp. 25 TaxID=2302933 RepID=UPI0013D6CACC|nr:hypothetical protein [Dysgonomonas sp. 25]NDV68160.1 hypothetical protein [Dysgonomonas sp. 25]